MKNKRNGTKNAAKVKETRRTSKRNGQKINITGAKGIFLPARGLSRAGITNATQGRTPQEPAKPKRRELGGAHGAPAPTGAGERSDPRAGALRLPAAAALAARRAGRP